MYLQLVISIPCTGFIWIRLFNKLDENAIGNVSLFISVRLPTLNFHISRSTISVFGVNVWSELKCLIFNLVYESFMTIP